MNSSDLLAAHNFRAVFAAKAGRVRESADAYWQAFLSLPDDKFDERRHYFFHGYADQLAKDNLAATEDDFDKLRNIMNDKNEPRLFRIEAGFTMAKNLHQQGKRNECRDMYYHAITIGKKNKKLSTLAKEEESMQIYAKKDGVKGMVKDKISMKKLIEMTLENCEKGATMSKDPKADFKGETPYFGPRGTTVTEAEFNNLIDVGGIYCDYCKKESKKLMKCARCNRAYYCDKNCSTNAWKEKEHRKYCRKEGQFELGDLVQLFGIKAEPGLNS